MNKRPPLTDLERQKGFNIRDKIKALQDLSTRELQKSKVWDNRNTKGNPVKKP